MTDLEFFTNLWERIGIAVYKEDENNAFVTYATPVTNRYNEDIGVMEYTFEIATGQLAEDPYLNCDQETIDQQLEDASIEEQIHYMGVLVDAMKEKI